MTHFGVYNYWLTGLTACDCWLVDSWLVVLSLLGTRYRPSIFIYYKWKDDSDKFESSETPTRTWTVSVTCSAYCRSNDAKSFRSRRNTSSDDASRSRIASMCTVNSRIRLAPYRWQHYKYRRGYYYYYYYYFSHLYRSAVTQNQKYKTNVVLAELL